MSKKLKFGLLNILIVLLVAAVGIFAVVVYSRKNLGKTTAPQQTVETLDGQVQKLNALESSDEVSSIEQDLNSTNLDDLDLGIAEVDSSLQGL